MHVLPEALGRVLRDPHVGAAGWLADDAVDDGYLPGKTKGLNISNRGDYAARSAQQVTWCKPSARSAWIQFFPLDLVGLGVGMFSFSFAGVY